MRNALIVLVLALCAVPRAFPTDQIPDKLVYEGESYYLYPGVLSPYLAERPEIKFPIASTGCYRGYIATFTIESGQLLLKHIRAPRKGGSGILIEEWPSVMNVLAPKENPLPADWFTGFILLSDHGKEPDESFPPEIRPVKRVVLLEIVEGRVVKERLFADLKAYEAFERAWVRDGKKSEAGKAYTESLRKKGLSDEQIAERLRGAYGKLGAFLYRANNLFGFIGERYVEYGCDRRRPTQSQANALH